MSRSIFKVLGSAAAAAIPTLFCNCEVCRYARKHGGKDVRLRTAYAIDDNIRLDFGPDALVQSIKFGLDGLNLQHLFFTHSHEDHLFAMDLETLMRREEKINIYGNEAVKNVLAEWYFFEERIIFHLLEPGSKVDIPESGITVTALQGNHIPTETTLFYLFEKNGKRLLIANDTMEIPECTVEKLAGIHLDYIFADCTWGENDRQVGHMGIPVIKRQLEKLRRVGAVDDATAVYPVHIGHHWSLPHDQLSMTPAYDGMEIEL